MDMTTDRMGNIVKVGSRLAVAFRVSNSADLRVGRVTGFDFRNEDYRVGGEWFDERPIMLIDWEWSALGYTLPANKKSYIYPDLKRFVVIAEEAHL